MTAKWEVLLPTGIDPSGPESMTDFAHCTGIDEYDGHEAALGDIGRYHAVVVRVAELDAEVIDRAKRLRVIAKHGSGLDNVDVAAATRRGVVVCNTPGANAQSVAEHAIALLFGVRRKLHSADGHVRSGDWKRAEFTGHELAGDTLGLFGFGAIAERTASLARGIGMAVLAFDPYLDDDRFPEGVERVETLETLFDRADAVSVHAPLTDGTRHSVSTEELAALGPNGVLINTARGAILEEAALVEAIEGGTLAGAGLDTFETEPPGEDHPLYDRDEVLLTPHIGGVTEQALVRTSRRAAANVRMVYEGGLPESTVNRAELTGEVGP